MRFSRKLWQIRTWFILFTYRNSYVGFHFMQWPLTQGDLERSKWMYEIRFWSITSKWGKNGVGCYISISCYSWKCSPVTLTFDLECFIKVIHSSSANNHKLSISMPGGNYAPSTDGLVANIYCNNYTCNVKSMQF